MRDDKWLFHKLDQVWDEYFPDVPQENDVRIVWGRRAKTRLGSIKLDVKDMRQRIGGKEHPATIITINSLFKDPAIPEFVVTATIAHELSHYAHGFNSPLERKYQTPHAGGVVHYEMHSRGLSDVLKKQKKWLRENWREYILKNLPQKTVKPKKKLRRVIIKWI